MTFEIESIEYQLGEEPILVRDLCIRNNRNFERLIVRSGFETVHHTNLSDELFFSNFLKNNLKTNPGDFIIFVNQSMTEIIPGKISRIFSDFLNVDKVFFIELSDGCSGFVRALVIADALLQSKNTTKVHIICAEKYSKYYSEADESVSPIFSDAISLTTLRQGKKYNLVSTAVKNSLSNSKLISTSLNSNHQLKLNMDGGSVLSWALSTIPEIIGELLMSANVERKDVNYWFLHQGSKVVVEMLTERIGLIGQDLFKATNVGNTVSSSIPIIWKQVIESNENVMSPGEIMVLAGFGVGLSAIAACIKIES